uniref:Uncharacterized protein n=1 Tax=Haptolina ericina TaxID=156174 RepID=A0A7S3BT80_9EUKA|mmetsp:Transcript_65957/g.147234  ORF Transcript_65957/g.147234 Transcript_65957/m.147234 type:complete len:392 (+) Transcript_65957:229-1404(+)
MSLSPMQAHDYYLVIHPTLHTSGFGNQIGMLIQHLAIAAASGRVLVLPPFHVPASHRLTASAPDNLLEPDTVLNLTSLAPLFDVLPLRHLPAASHDGAVLSWTAALPGAGGPRPLRLAPAPLDAALAAVQLLRQRHGCEEESSATGSDCRYVTYCHTAACRTRTRRACRRLRGGCSRTAQRLPNNYLFAHRLVQLLCGVSPDKRLSRGTVLITGSESPGDLMLDALQRHALSRLQLADAIRMRATELARRLGNFAAIHLRLNDVRDPGSKGFNSSSLPGALRALLPHLQLHTRIAAGGATDRGASDSQSVAGESASTDGQAMEGVSVPSRLVVYIASNQPDAVAAMRPAFASILMGVAAVQDWRALMGVGTRGGLVDALTEHELCVTARAP